MHLPQSSYHPNEHCRESEHSCNSGVTAGHAADNRAHENKPYVFLFTLKEKQSKQQYQGTKQLNCFLFYFKGKNQNKNIKVEKNWIIFLSTLKEKDENKNINL